MPAAKTLYLTNTVTDSFQQLSETSPGADATTSPVVGFIPGTAASGFIPLDSGSEVSTTAGSATDGTINATTGDCFRAGPFTGTFASGNWDFHFVLIAVTNGGAQDGRIRFRIHKSANANGSSSSQLLAEQTCSTLTNLGTSSALDSSLTVNPGAITLSNEYLFIEVGWDITGAGGMSTADADFRIGGSSTRIVTSTFTGLLNASVNDAITVAEAVTRVAVLLRALSESITVADAASRVGGLPRAVSDAITVAEAATRVAGNQRAVSDAITVLESLQGRLPTYLRRTVFEAGDTREDDRTLSVLDVATAQLLTRLARSVSDGITTTDAVKAAVSLGARLAETLTLIDAPKAVITPLVVRALESLSVVEAAAASTLLVRIHALVAEDIGVAEDVTALLKLVRLTVLVAEDISAAENLTAPLTPLIQRLAEALAVLDAVKAVLPLLTARPAEALTALDEAVAELQTVRLTLAQFEAIGVSDVAKAVLPLLVARVAETISVAEAVTAQLIAAGLSTLRADGIAVEDAVFARLIENTYQTLHETITVVESVKVVLDKLAVHGAEAISLEDVLTAVLTPSIQRPFEDISVADAVRAVLHLGSRNQELIAVADAVKAVLTPSVLRLAETITVSEFARAAIDTLSSQRFEAITVADVVKAVVSPLAVHAADAIALQDAATMLLRPLLARPFEQVTVADLASAALATARLKTQRADVVAVAEFVKAAMTATAKPVEAITLQDVARAVLSPMLQARFDLVTVVDLARAALTPFLTRQAETLSLAEFVKAVVNPLVARPADAITVSEAVSVLFDKLVARPAELVTVADVAKAVLPELVVRSDESILVEDVVRAVIPVFSAKPYDTITVTERIAVFLEEQRILYETITVEDVVLLSLTTIVQFVTGDLRAEDSRSRLAGELRGSLVVGALSLVMAPAGTLRNLSTPMAVWASGGLRAIPSVSGYLRRLPPSLAARLAETLSVVDRAYPRVEPAP